MYLPCYALDVNIRVNSELFFYPSIPMVGTWEGEGLERRLGVFSLNIAFMDSTFTVEYLDFGHVLTMLKLDHTKTVFSRVAVPFISKGGSNCGFS